MAFTLKNFIYDSGFNNLKLLTCQEKIGSPITGVNVIDNPDVALWVKPGEMVLTTGYFFANDLNLQTNVIINLKSTGCVALCIKMKRFFPEVPASFIETAERAGLPIIDLPLEYPFSDITQKIHAELNANQLSKIQQEQAVFNALLNTFPMEDSLKTCLKLLSDFLSVPLFITDAQLKCFYYYIRPEDKSLLDSDNTLTFKIPDGKKPVLSQDEVTTLDVTLNSCRKTIMLIPFHDGTHFLCIPNEKPISLEFVQSSMKLLRLPSEQAVRAPGNFSEYYSELFRFLLSSEQKRADVDRICEYYGYPHCKAQLLVLFSLCHEAEDLRMQEPIAFLKELLATLSCKPSTYFLAFYKRQICLFFFTDKESGCQKARKCAQDFQKKYHATFVVGISQLIRGDREILKTYEQAAFLLSLSNVFPSKNLFYFKDYLLFSNIKELAPETRQKIYEDTVKPLIDYDKKNNSNFLETLLQYFDSRFNASLAAKQLYVHRNTFLKRMQKID